VHDQNLNPVSGAAVTLIAHFPTGDQIVTMPITDEQGVSQVTLTFEGQPAGSDVNLEFRVVRGEMQASTRDSFKIWW
jgi:hypothetical protein